MEKTGSILKRYMRHGMTQIELGKRMEVTPQYINNIMNNIKGPSENFLEKFYEIFNVTEEDKNKIREYEDFRKIPKKYQEELLFFRGEGIQIEKSEVKVLGSFNPGNIFGYEEKDERLYFPKLSADESSLFAIRLNCADYMPYYLKDDILLFRKGYEKSKDYYSFHKKICLIKYKADIFIKEVKFINEIIILKTLNHEEDLILLKAEEYENMEVAGILEGYFRTGL